MYQNLFLHSSTDCHLGWPISWQLWTVAINMDMQISLFIVDLGSFRCSGEWSTWVTWIPCSVRWGTSVLISIVTVSGNTLSQARLGREAGLSCGQDVWSFFLRASWFPFWMRHQLPFLSRNAWLWLSWLCSFQSSLSFFRTFRLSHHPFPLFRTDSLPSPWHLPFIGL